MKKTLCGYTCPTRIIQLFGFVASLPASIFISVPWSIDSIRREIDSHEWHPATLSDDLLVPVKLNFRSWWRRVSHFATLPSSSFSFSLVVQDFFFFLPKLLYRCWIEKRWVMYRFFIISDWFEFQITWLASSFSICMRDRKRKITVWSLGASDFRSLFFLLSHSVFFFSNKKNKFLLFLMKDKLHDIYKSHIAIKKKQF